jgi:hypothetical protein
MKAIRALAIILIASNLSGCAVVPYAISAAMIGGGNEIVNGGAIGVPERKTAAKPTGSAWQTLKNDFRESTADLRRSIKPK